MGIIAVDSIKPQNIRGFTLEPELKTYTNEQVNIMAGHAHTEVIDALTLADFIVLLVVFLLLFTGTLYILGKMKRYCIKHIQKEILREVK